jgi:tRNA(adenine34) deaminase
VENSHDLPSRNTREQTDERWMNEALIEAGKAFALDEIPVGAVLISGDECLARAHDMRESTGDPTAHAEILVLRDGARLIGDWRLCECDLYVTLEPCPMCAGALILARIRRLIYGAPNAKSGAVETHCNLLAIEGFNHKVEVISGVLTEPCAELLKKFFADKR